MQGRRGRFGLVWLVWVGILTLALGRAGPLHAQDWLRIQRGDIMTAQGATPVYTPFRLCAAGQVIGSDGVDIVCLTPGGSGGPGTVTSVNWGSVAAIFAPTVTAPTGAAVLNLPFTTEAANTVLAGPTSGAAALPTFRLLTTGDLPAGTGTLTSISQGTGIVATPNPITATGTIALADTAVTPGSYTYAGFTVDQQGRLTAASNGATLGVTGGGTGVTSWTPYAVVIGGMTSTGPLQQVSGLGAASDCLTSAGAGGPPTWAPCGGSVITLPVVDTQTIVKGSSDATKLMRFEVDGFTTGVTRVMTLPNQDATVAGINVSQVWTADQQFMGGTAASLGLKVGGVDRGITDDGDATTLSMTVGATDRVTVVGNGSDTALRIRSAGRFAWGTTDNPVATEDTSIRRDAAGVVGIWGSSAYGAMQLGTGSAGAPALRFGSSATGISDVGALTNLTFSTQGSSRMTIENTGHASIARVFLKNQGKLAWGDDGDPIANGTLGIARFNGTSSTELMVYDGTLSTPAGSNARDLGVRDLFLYSAGDTNTLRLTGTPTGARVLTLPDTTGTLLVGPTLAFGSGGTGLATAADDTVMISSGSAWVASAIPNCTDTGGNHLNYTASTNALSCGTSGGGSGANTALSNLASVAINADLVGAVSGGMGVRGGSAANDDLILEGTTSATRTTSYVSMQPNGGNVAIGAAAAGAKLEIDDTSKTVASGNANQYIFTTDSQAIDKGGSIGLGGNYNGTAAQAPFGYIAGRKENGTNNDQAGYLVLGTRAASSATTEAMRISSAGKVGIGTTTPSVSLEVGVATPAQIMRVVDASIAHGMTSLVPTNVISDIGDASGSGGILMRGYNQSAGAGGEGLVFHGIDVGASTTGAVVAFKAGKKSGTTSGNTAGTDLAFSFQQNDGTTNLLSIIGSGNTGIGVTAPTAVLHLKAGTATASTAPLKMNSGTLLTTPEAGAIEFLTDTFYGTATTGTERKAVVMTPGNSRVTSDVTSVTTNMANVTGLTSTLTASAFYSGRLVLFVDDSVAADGFAFDFDGGTATFTDFRAHCTVFDTALGLSSQATAKTTDFNVTTLTGNSMVECYLGLQVNAGGTFIPRFAQNAHTTGTATVHIGSYMTLSF